MSKWIVIPAVAAIVLVGCATMEGENEREESIPLSEVPVPAIEAAGAAVDGIVLTEAEIEEEDGQTVYELVGVANGKEYEIEVTAEGEVLEVEEEDEDDDDDDDD